MGCVLALSTAPLANALAQPHFTRVGDLPGGPTASFVTNISADGNTVVGRSFDAVIQRGFRWTAIEGMVPFQLDDIPEAAAICNDASADGRIIVGVYTIPFLVKDEAFRWDINGDIEIVWCTQCQKPYSAEFISDDGLVVVGNDPGGIAAFLWTDAGGSVLIPSPIAGTATFADDISGDGLVVVGFISNLNDIERAFRFSVADGTVELGDLPGGIVSSRARATSTDGQVIVGRSNSVNNTSPTQFEAFRWTPDTGMIGLGDFPGGAFSSSASAISGDAGVICGFGTSDSGVETFLWTEAAGLRKLVEVLRLDYGLERELAGWTLRNVAGISADGLVICGNGIDPDGYTQGWIANLRGACPADFNTDGAADSQDLFDYLTAFFTIPNCPDCNEPPQKRPPCRADINADCLINSADFFEFLEMFFAGCS